MPAASRSLDQSVGGASSTPSPTPTQTPASPIPSEEEGRVQKLYQAMERSTESKAKQRSRDLGKNVASTEMLGQLCWKPRLRGDLQS